MKQTPPQIPLLNAPKPQNPKPSPIMAPHTTTWSSASFEAFFEGWLVRQEHYLDELLSAEPDSNQELASLISRVLSHYQDYFEAKSSVILNDVFLVFSPTWFSALENSFLWIAGFKPALVFRLLGNEVRDLTAEQAAAVEALRREVEGEEVQLERELAMVQESVAGPGMVEMARRLVDGERREVDALIEVLRNSMMDLVQRADHLRVETAQKVIQVLNPVQGVKLLVSAARLQLRIRNCGAALHQPRNR